MISAKDNTELTALFDSHKDRYKGRREDYFALLYLTRKWGLAVDQLAHQVAFGGRDYGFDAYHVDIASRNLYLYQFKWSESLTQLKTSMERMSEAGLNHVFGDALPDRDENTVLSQLRAEIAEHRHAIEAVYVQFVFKGDATEAETSESLGIRREDIENKVHLVRSYFGEREVDLRVQILADRPGSVSRSVVQSFSVRCDQVLRHDVDDKALFVALIPLVDLHRIHEALRATFLDRNVRGALSADAVPNRKIHDALKRIVLDREEEPEVFAFRHNGVTLAAERVEQRDDGALVLHVPRLLNGAQSVSMLGQFLAKHEQHPRLRDGKEVLDRILVLAKIVEAHPGSDFVTDVTIATNQQNAVKPWALRAMDRRQVDIADWLRSHFGIYYSRQEGMFENMPASERERLGIRQSRDMRILHMAQSLMALDGSVTNMRRLPEVFTSSAVYQQVFREQWLTGDPRVLVVAYKVGEVLRPVIQLIESKLPQMYQAAARPAKNLVWALTVQAILNGPNLEDMLEEHGTTMVRTAIFKEIAEKLGSSRVFPLLNDLIRDPRHASRAAEGKFEFLRTEAAFKQAMKCAKDKWRWEHRRN